MNRLFYRKLAILTVLFGCFSFVGLNSEVLTLDDAIESALENNTERKIAELNVRQANADVKTAYGYAMPTVDVSAQFSHFFKKPKVPFMDFEALLNNSTYGVLFEEGVIEYDPSKLQPMGTEMMSMSLANNVSAEAQVSQVLFNSNVIKGIGSSKIYFDMSKYQLEQKAASTVNTVTKVFYGCVLAKEMLEIAQASLEIYERNYQTVAALHKEGFASEYDRLTAEVQYENFKPVVSQARTGLQEAKNGLKILVGIDPSEKIEIVGELNYEKEDLQSELLIESALQNNYNIGLLEYKQQIDDAFIDLEESGYWPTLAAFGSVSYNGTSDDWDMLSYNQALAGLSFSMNLFKGMRTSNQVQKKKIERLKTDENLRMAKDGIVVQIENILDDIEEIKTNIQSAEKNIALAEKGYEIAQVRYKEGDGTQVELMNAEIQLRSARTNVLNYYYRYVAAVEDLKYITGDIEDKYIDKFKVENFSISE